MAIFIVSQPTQTVLPVYDDIIFVLRQTGINLSSTSIAQFAMYLEFNFTTEDGATTIKRTLKAKANAEERFIFNASNVLSDFVSTDKFAYDGGLDGLYAAEVDESTVSLLFPKSIHRIDKFSRNKNAFTKVTIKAYKEYLNTSTQVYTSNNNTTTIGDYFIFNGTSQISRNSLSTSLGAKDYITNYELKAGSDNQFLTSFAPTTKRYVRWDYARQKGDYATFAFINGGFPAVVGDTFDYEAGFGSIEYKFYSSDDTLLQTSTHSNSNTNGGEVTLSGGGTPITTPSGTFEENNAGFLYVAVGPQNIRNSGISIPATTNYYTVKAINGGSTADSSTTYTFYLQDDDCKGFETIRLVWLNRLGGWEYYNITKKSTRSVSIERATLKQNYGSWDSSFYNHDTFEGGTKNHSIQAIENIECNTDFITEDEASVLEQLFTSPEVYMQIGVGATDVTYKPVVVTEKDYIKQTTANDMLKQYILNVEISHETRVQGI